MVEQLANESHDAGEPPITALVVNAQTGAPGAGWHGNGEPWYAVTDSLAYVSTGGDVGGASRYLDIVHVDDAPRVVQRPK